jgi:hypothetical protein
VSGAQSSELGWARAVSIDYYSLLSLETGSGRQSIVGIVNFVLVASSSAETRTGNKAEKEKELCVNPRS